MVGKAAISLAGLATLGTAGVAAAPPDTASSPSPIVRIESLPDQGGLYAVIVNEFVRLGWKTVCVAVEAGPQGGPVDPPAEVIANLKRASRAFRPMSECRQDGEEVIDRSGGADPVAVTLAGVEAEAADHLVRVQWCCWTGWGTFRLVYGKRGWRLKRTESWLQT